jgi:putative transposase
LGCQGLRVSKTKLQFVEEEVKYLGHLIGQGNQRLGPEIIEGITHMPLPKTRRELQKFLGLIGYCRLWLESYPLKTKTLYFKLLEEEPNPFCWEPEDLQIIESLKQSLIMAPLLSLEKPFHLFVNVDKGTALGVLTQEEKKNRWPIYPNFLIL